MLILKMIRITPHEDRYFSYKYLIYENKSELKCSNTTTLEVAVSPRPKSYQEDKVFIMQSILLTFSHQWHIMIKSINPYMRY